MYDRCYSSIRDTDNINMSKANFNKTGTNTTKQPTTKTPRPELPGHDYSILGL